MEADVERSVGHEGLFSPPLWIFLNINQDNTNSRDVFSAKTFHHYSCPANDLEESKCCQFRDILCNEFSAYLTKTYKGTQC